jgi:imidazole glycerol-phosphate synthase subunit HisF
VTFPRLIPVVTLIGDGAYKTKQFSNPKYIGDPANTVSLFSSFEAEELMVFDISESFQELKASKEVLSQIIENASMPIAFGGGVKSIEDAHVYFDLGFDKVVIRTGLSDPMLVERISAEYGTQAVAGCLDFELISSRTHEIKINNVVFSFDQIPTLLMRLQDSGLGEVVIQDIKSDGLRSGLQSSLLLELAVEKLDIPVVALGGCSNEKNAADFIKQSRCHSVAAATTFLFHQTRDAVLINYPTLNKWHQNFEGR